MVRVLAVVLVLFSLIALVYGAFFESGVAAPMWLFLSLACVLASVWLWRR